MLAISLPSAPAPEEGRRASQVTAFAAAAFFSASSFALRSPGAEAPAGAAPADPAAVAIELQGSNMSSEAPDSPDKSSLKQHPAAWILQSDEEAQRQVDRESSPERLSRAKLRCRPYPID